MDAIQLEKLGDELRGIGHKRRKLVEQIFEEVNEGDHQSSNELLNELSNISNQAIEIIVRQKQILVEEVDKM
jgi:hypothetical protein